jgi:CheY-like chemotaxis protein
MVLERKKILLVDPDVQAMQPLKTLLLQRGCRVGQVDSGERALQLCARELPDAIITGLRLPKMTGEELLQALREDERTTGVPVVIIAEERLLDDRVRVIELFPDDFVPKPYVAQEVVARLEVLLNEVHRVSFAPGAEELEKGFSGSLADMSPVDLIEIFHAAGRTGVLHLRNNGQRGAIYLREGEIVDAVFAQRRGEEALAVLLLWNEGTFLADFTAVENPQRVATETRELLATALARAEEWNEAVSALPPLHALLQRTGTLQPQALDEEEQALLERFASPRSIDQILEGAAADPLPLVRRLRVLWEKGLLQLCSEEERPSTTSALSTVLHAGSGTGKSPLAAVAELFASAAGMALTTTPDAAQAASPSLSRAELMVMRARLG